MLGHLGDARGLIISPNAWGFPLSSPYTHRWPMTHQPLHPHSKPLLHYLNREASCRKVGGRTFGFSSFIISSSSCKWHIHSLDHVSMGKCWTCCSFLQHDIWKGQGHFYLDLPDWGVCRHVCVTKRRHFQRLTSLRWGSQWSDFCQISGMFLHNDVLLTRCSPLTVNLFTQVKLQNHNQARKKH